MSMWNGFKAEEFIFEGREAVIVFPEKPEEGMNWTLKTEYWGAFPETEIELLKRGFHCAYLKNTSRFAPVEDCDAKAEFVEYLHKKYGLRKKCVPVGMSLGGAHAVTFAGFYPQYVACMFIDAPVLNYMSLPAKIGNAYCEQIWENEFVKTYPGIKRYQMLKFENHPINKVDVLIENKIPVLMLYGTEDCTVIYEENGKLMEEAYEEYKELLTVMPRNCQGHHPHGFPQNPEIVADFIVNHVN